MCETDYSGYPDCRDQTIRAMAQALSLGMDRSMSIHTPLMWIDKAATWRLAESLGGEALVRLIVEETHTCYLGERGRRFDWGYGCGECPACKLRAHGWENYRAGQTQRDRLRPPDRSSVASRPQSALTCSRRATASLTRLSRFGYVML